MSTTRHIIDISAIDLDACVADRDAIAVLNPHRGDMVMLDRVVWASEDLQQAIGVKYVRDDEFWVPGHIPGYPLMPGVLMLEAAAQLSSYIYYRRSGMTWFAGFTRIENTVFRGQVRPGDELYLLAIAVKYHLKRFVTQVQGVVNGEVVFEAKITGMAFPNVGKTSEEPSSTGTV